MPRCLTATCSLFELAADEGDLDHAAGHHLAHLGDQLLDLTAAQALVGAPTGSTAIVGFHAQQAAQRR